MAKVIIEIEDQPGGELSVRFAGDDLRTAATAQTNTPAQNAAIYLAQQMREVGMNAPDLFNGGYLDEAQYLLNEGRRIGAIDSARKD